MALGPSLTTENHLDDTDITFGLSVERGGKAAKLIGKRLWLFPGSGVLSGRKDGRGGKMPGW